MRITRLFVDQALAVGNVYTLKESDHHYVSRVLRLRVSDSLHLFNGDGFDYHGVIADLSKQYARIALVDKAINENESPLQVCLVMSICKHNKMEWVVQKATELGVTNIQPVISEYSQVRLDRNRLQKKVSQWSSIAQQAAQQCGRHVPPMVQEVDSFEHAITHHQGALLVLHPSASQPMHSVNTPSSLTLAVGPEGGFSEQEIAMVLAQQGTTVRVGKRILRAETAPIVALSLAQSLWGDLQ